MKATIARRRSGAVRPVDPQNARFYRAAILLVSLTAGGAALAQTTNAPPAAATPDTGSGTNVVKLAPTTVVGKLDVAREQIVPELGATVYTIDKAQIQALPAGENTPVNQVLLRAPGTAQDSAANGGLHLRGEHANLQYRINDVLLPEGITGFGQELSARWTGWLLPRERAQAKQGRRKLLSPLARAITPRN